jgi:hypothetical protein
MALSFTLSTFVRPTVEATGKRDRGHDGIIADD